MIGSWTSPKSCETAEWVCAVQTTAASRALVPLIVFIKGKARRPLTDTEM